MFVRGSGAGLEYKRVDNSFYRGIVVKNNDPEKLNRIKVYIPELSNQPYDDWFEEYDNININSIGENIKTEWNKKEINGDWSDVDIYEEIAAKIPWAEQCFPLFGESGNFRYYKGDNIATISDGNYDRAWTYNRNATDKSGLLAFSTADKKALKAFQINDITTPNESSDNMNSIISVSPAYWYENIDHHVSDLSGRPTNSSMSYKSNTYSAQYKPSNNDNKSKGVFGIPELGSKVWIFHYEGDLNFPIYFGVAGKSKRELSIINNTDNPTSTGLTYPMDFEN